MTDVSDLTVLSDADLVGADILYITDVSGPDVPRQITRDNLVKEAHADIYVENKSGSQVLTGAGTFDIVTQFDTDGLGSNATPDQTNNKITIPNVGHYRISFGVSCSLTDTVCDLRFIAFWNGIQTHIMARVNAPVAVDDAVNVVAEGNFIVSLASQDLDLRVEGSLASTLRIFDGSLTIKRIGG